MVALRMAAALAPLLLLLSGCVGSSGASDASRAATSAGPAEVDANTGGIEGIVTDDSLVPIAGAIVGVVTLGLTTQTDGNGHYAVSKVPPGKQPVAAQQLGYSSDARSVDVAAGQVTTVNFRLVPLAVDDPYYVMQKRAGRIFCGVAVRSVVSFAACGAVYNTPLNGTDTFVVPFTLTAQNNSRLQTLVFETGWRPSQTFGRGLSVNWEVYQEITATYGFTEKLRKFANVSGVSPLKTFADADQIRGTLKEKPYAKYCPWGGTCRLWARSFPHPSTLGPGYPTDFALYVDQAYTHYVTEFFGEPAPEAYTALSDS